MPGQVARVHGEAGAGVDQHTLLGERADAVVDREVDDAKTEGAARHRDEVAMDPDQLALGAAAEDVGAHAQGFPFQMV